MIGDLGLIAKAYDMIGGIGLIAKAYALAGQRLQRPMTSALAG